MTTYAVQPRGSTQPLAAVLAEQVRVRVRDEGVDPQSQASAVRSIAESVVQAHDRRSLTGAVDPVDDLPGMVDEMVSRVSGFGALQRYLDDPSIEEVWINEPSRVFVARHGRHELTSTLLTGEEVRELVERMLKSSGRRLDLSQPLVRFTNGHLGAGEATANDGVAGDQRPSWQGAQRRMSLSCYSSPALCRTRRVGTGSVGTTSGLAVGSGEAG